MRLRQLYHRHKVMLLDLLLLLVMFSGLWKAQHTLTGFLCGLGTGIMLYRIGERFSQEKTRKA
jgi:hypothetical protein